MAVAGAVRTVRGWAIAAGVLLIFAGLLALGAPFLAALVAALWVAWGLIFGGVAEMISAFSTNENRLWKILLGALYLLVGGYVLVHPASGIEALALVLGWLLLLQGVVSIFGSLQLRPVVGWGWWLFDGIITVILGILILEGWPGNSVVILSILIGISMIVSGANRLALAAAR